MTMDQNWIESLIQYKKILIDINIIIINDYHVMEDGNRTKKEFWQLQIPLSIDPPDTFFGAGSVSAKNRK